MCKTNGYDTHWYRQWFGTEYLQVYRHRDENDAAELIQLFLRTVKPVPGQRFLDVACGNGRHARILNRYGLRVTGIDLSAPLLRHAQRNTPQHSDLLYIRADMRALPVKTKFDGALSLFTSFGYFAKDAENALVLQEIARVILTGGIYFLDYLNPPFVKEHLIEESVRHSGSIRIKEKRYIENQRVHKEITLDQNDRKKSFHESVRLYSYDEMSRMLLHAGFSVQASYGNYKGETYTTDSERMILFCRKK